MSIVNALAQTYFDACDIYRYEATVIKGVTRNAEVLKYSNIKCALSQGSLVKAAGDNVTEISASSKVFFTPDTDVKEGDKLIITQQGATHSKVYKVGEVFLYSGSHIEARVSRSDKA